MRTQFTGPDEPVTNFVIGLTYFIMFVVAVVFVCIVAGVIL